MKQKKASTVRYWKNPKADCFFEMATSRSLGLPDTLAIAYNPEKCLLMLPVIAETFINLIKILWRNIASVRAVAVTEKKEEKGELFELSEINKKQEKH